MSRFSPKNAYRVEVTFKVASPELGNVVSNTGSSLEEMRTRAQQLAGNRPSYVNIFHNELTFPQFNWVKVESYELN